MFKLIVILFAIKLYAWNDIFKYFGWDVCDTKQVEDYKFIHRLAITAIPQNADGALEGDISEFVLLNRISNQRMWSVKAVLGLIKANKGTSNKLSLTDISYLSFWNFFYPGF